MSRLKKILFLLEGCLLVNAGFCQPNTELWFQSLAGLQNYSPSFNYFVYNDSEGFTWISSTAGLNRFDGRRVKHYSSIPGDTTSLMDDNVQSTFFEDKRKNLWFSTGRAIHCYRRKSDDFQRFIPKIKGELASEDYRPFFLEKDSFIWFRASQGIYRLNIHQPTHPPDSIAPCKSYRCTADTLADGTVGFIYQEGKISEGYLEIRHGKALPPRQWFENAAPVQKQSPLHAVYREPETIWLGTGLGLIALNPSTGEWRLAGGKGYEHCDFVPWGNKHLIVWTPKGLYLFEKDLELFSPLGVRTTAGNQFSPTSIFNIYLDREENLWVSFLSSGLVHANLKKVKFRSLPKNPSPIHGATNYAYWSCLKDTDGTFWHGTSTDGLFRLRKDGQLLQHYQHHSGDRFSLPSNWVLDLVQEENGRIWVATDKGLAWLDTRTHRFYKVSDRNGIDTFFILKLYRLNNGDLLAALYDLGVFKVEEKNGRFVFSKRLTSQTSYPMLFEDQQGNIYACRNEREVEVYRRRKENWSLIGSIPVSGLVNGFYEDTDRKNLWIGSFSGLAKVNLPSLKVDTVFTEKDGLPDKNIHCMLSSQDRQSLWLGTPKGLVKFNFETLKFHTYDLADGAQSLEFNLNSAARMSNGEIWFGGSNGITIVPPGQLDIIKNPAFVKITGIKINDEVLPGLKCAATGAVNVSQMEHINLKWSQNTVTLEFVAIEYSDPGNNQLRYFLKGVDKDTVTLAKGEPGFARYSNLTYGRHTLWLQGANSDGVWGKPVPVLKITVQPPFYFNPWFVAFSVLALAVGTWAFASWRIRQVREKGELKARSAENRMAALRAQMDPHFIFNSLNTVNAFIMRQDLKGAVEYVSHFSKLLRKTLEHSRVTNIPLEQEIELLELYMKIEARRFKQPFDYRITTGKDVDMFSLEIPSMLLQPFVENAIKHGLFHRKQPGGHINIEFLRENGSLKCVVEDNGVGRATAAELNAQQGRTHISRGLQIVEERLQLLQMSDPKDGAIKTIDLFDLQSNPTGTKVEITLPLDRMKAS